ncbi:hypothetical protein C9374_001233 [Naegleria lovaniensis]|uniref:Transglutaminase-like domain-containing protein n=1 Tax=Naegleria lovaniensis TaxID=51637 RepID=A0AA88KN54_NAELO|nr:uncharacterized protein C9374_001233 [Naegleria lovaniensis]KAG2387639.1 hypothetical protein C9374_001233 [Naegleria lovaniensis]
MGIICVTDKNVGGARAHHQPLPTPAILHPKRAVAKPLGENASSNSTPNQAGSDPKLNGAASPHTSKFQSPITTKYAIKYHEAVNLEASLFSSVYKNQKYLLCTAVPPEIPFYQTDIKVETNPSLTSFYTTLFQERPSKKKQNNLLHIVSSSDSFDIAMGEDFRNHQEKKQEFVESPIPLFICNLVKHNDKVGEDDFSVHEFIFNWKYTKRELIPITGEGEINLEPVKRLEPKEHAFYTSETPLYNFKDPNFQKWQKKHELEIRDEEDAIDFLQRGLNAVWASVDVKATNYHRAAATTVLEAKNDSSFGLVTLFIAVCRANGIPSRAHFGYQCSSADKKREHKRLLKTGISPSLIYTEFHSKAEVWIDNLGWIPVEVADKEKGITNAEPIPFLTSHFFDNLSMDMRPFTSRSSTLNYCSANEYKGTSDEIKTIFKTPEEEKFDGAIVKLCNDFLMLWQAARRKRSMDMLRQTFAKLSNGLREEFHQECTVFDSVFFQGYDITFLPFKVTSRKTNKDGICHSTIMFTDLQTMETEEYIISLDIEDDFIADINIAPYLACTKRTR